MQFIIENTPVWMSQGSVPVLVDVLNFGTLLFLFVCGFTDLFYRKIFNKVTFSGMLAGVALNALTSGWIGLQSSLLGLFIGFGLFFVVWIFNGVGGGDVKLMGAIGALQGYPFIVYATVLSILFGFVGAVYAMVSHGHLTRSLMNVAGVAFGMVRAQVQPGYQPPKLDPKNSRKIRFGYGCIVGTMVAWLLTGLGYLTLPH